LHSDSDSDSEDSGSPTPRPARRGDVSEPVNTLATSELTEEQDHILCAISESRSSDIIGVAVINVTIGQVDIIRIVNDDRYRRLTETLSRLPTWPQTFLVLKKVVDHPGTSSLSACLVAEFPKAEIVALDREHWNEADGLRMVDRFAWRKDIKAIRRSLENNFYASCAFAAVCFAPTDQACSAYEVVTNTRCQVMAYVEEETPVVFRENSLHVKYRRPADTMGLDRSTITSLELFQNARNIRGKPSTLFGLLNNALTPQGRRMIRSALLQPSTNKDEIVARHAAVEELSSNEDLFTEVRASLKRLLHIDIERSIPWVMTENICLFSSLFSWLTPESDCPDNRTRASSLAAWSDLDRRSPPDGHGEP
jgi:DNA mismatch repair protein MSH4